MFDFIFGGKRKLALINKLYDQRLRNDDIAYGLNKKKLSKVQLLSTPEGTIITIIQTVIPHLVKVKDITQTKC